MKKKSFFSIGSLSAMALLIVVGSTYAALSTRPWESGTWTNLSGSERATQIRSWIDSNMSQASTLSTKPWDDGGYASLTTAEQNSEQRDWQYLKRRVSDEYPMIIGSDKVVDSHATNEYFIPEKTAAEWTAFYNAVSAGQVPDLSLEATTNYAVTSISVGHGTGCAISPAGRAYCWGYNSGTGQHMGASGSVGNGTTGDKNSPQQVSGNHTDWTSIASYFTGSCGIRNGGELYCWGHNWGNSVGDGTTTQRLSPVQVGTATDWTSIDVNSWGSCGTRANGRAYCWGFNLYGSFGQNLSNTARVTTPSEVHGGYTDWEIIDLGWGAACGIRNGGELWCWGASYHGDTPSRVQTATDWVDIAVKEEDVQCGIRSTGRAYCWTINNGIVSNMAELSGGYTDWTSIGEGCGVRNGRAYCWGHNSSGRIGDGTQTDRTNPTLVSGGYTDWVAVESQSHSSCGYRSNGQGYCWGRGWFGQLGTGSGSSSFTPSPIAGISIGN